MYRSDGWKIPVQHPLTFRCSDTYRNDICMYLVYMVDSCIQHKAPLRSCQLVGVFIVVELNQSRDLRDAAMRGQNKPHHPIHRRNPRPHLQDFATVRTGLFNSGQCQSIEAALRAVGYLYTVCLHPALGYKHNIWAVRSALTLQSPYSNFLSTIIMYYIQNFISPRT